MGKEIFNKNLPPGVERDGKSNETIKKRPLSRIFFRTAFFRKQMAITLSVLSFMSRSQLQKVLSRREDQELLYLYGVWTPRKKLDFPSTKFVDFSYHSI